MEFVLWTCYGSVGYFVIFSIRKEIKMTDMKDLPKQMVKLESKYRQYDLIDLFIVSFYNFFTFALGMGCGFLLWGMK